jgi:hypothetical protein
VRDLNLKQQQKLSEDVHPSISITNEEKFQDKGIQTIITSEQAKLKINRLKNEISLLQIRVNDKIAELDDFHAKVQI